MPPNVRPLLYQKLNQVADLQGNDVWGGSDNLRWIASRAQQRSLSTDLSTLIEDFQCGTTLAYWLLKRGFEPVKNWVLHQSCCPPPISVRIRMIDGIYNLEIKFGGEHVEGVAMVKGNSIKGLDSDRIYVVEFSGQHGGVLRRRWWSLEQNRFQSAVKSVCTTP